MKKQKSKMEIVMGEYKRGTLKSGSGQVVKSRAQAIAIGMSEMMKHGGGVRAHAMRMARKHMTGK